ncbi:phospholipase A1-II 5-like [Phragmites australis]|uniref:phospholipase A1-II 5-like n=1 Tax=Phragmites australis TaxID=29695 RepID=UPI002D77CD8E|nr:phospholipase A1-II 5-like [Phragmites australis]
MEANQGVLLSSNLVGGAKGSAAWPELLGSAHWDGLLDPLDLTLRRLILLCGDLCQVTYDSFNSDVHSMYCGSCRYSKSTLFSRTMFPAAADVSVAAYLYATSVASFPGGIMVFSLSREAWSKESNWIGYVAVSTDAAAAATGRRVIYVAWRGTIRTLEWVDVLKPELVSPDAILPEGDPAHGHARVMKGWYLVYTSSDERSPFSKYSARDQLHAAVRELVAKYKNENLSIVCTGHSLGASLATLCAFDIAVNGVSKVGGADIPVTAIVFGSPQIGNPEFKKRFDELPNLRALHVRNKPDVIPLYPSGFLGYANVGDLLVVDSKKSPYVKDNSTNIGDYHNLQGILHTVAGWNGEDGEFKLQVHRSVALVNKSSAFLKDENLVPESWWVEKNKGMVIGETGLWQLQPPVDENLPVPPVVTGMVMDDDVAVSKEPKIPAEEKKKKGAGTKLFSACLRGVN